MTRLRTLLHDEPPFRAPPPDAAPDRSGWGSTHPMFAAAIRGLRPDCVIEVGTWKGGSAIHMAELMRDEGIDGEIVCVDTWLGAPIAWTTHREELMASLRLRDGYPRLFETFARNVREAGVEAYITPLPAPSDGAATILRHYGMTASLIYIDGDHDLEPCRRDLETYLPLLRDDGVLIADDFGCFPGVTEAVTAFADAHDLYAVKQREKVALSRIDVAAALDLRGDGHYGRRPASAAPRPRP
jgi:predicted O-methyltransferase YrrM